MRNTSGYSLVELLIVVAILTLIAAAAVPSIQRDETEKLDRAASAVAAALRFAQSEAVRTGEAHGLTISQATQRVTVSRYDIATAPISAVYTLTNPFDKQPYDFNINTDRGTAGVTISNSQDVFNFVGLGRRRSMIFDAWGTPKWIVGSTSTTYLLADGSVQLSYGSQQRIVEVDAVTGRVTIE